MPRGHRDEVYLAWSLLHPRWQVFRVEPLGDREITHF